jgi:uncharacterized protein DUF6504
MPRYVHEKIAIRLRRGGAAPARFDWQERRYTVQSVEACWKEIGPWWDGNGERTYFRVAARLDGSSPDKALQIANRKLKIANYRRPTPNTQHPTPNTQHPTPGIYELCYDHESERWFLETVED